MDYFLSSGNWSMDWLLGLAFIGLSYLFALRTTTVQKYFFFMALALLYLVFGSPLNGLNDFGLHSATMLQQMLVLLVIPVLVLKSVPASLFEKSELHFLYAQKEAPADYLLPWAVGAIAMWAGHFLTAAILSAKTGVAICGITAPQGIGLDGVSENLVLVLLFMAGLFFALPVFHPDTSKRLSHVKRLMYLFTACISCSLLGLYVTFSASSASALIAEPVFTTMRNPFPLSLRNDQELAGMLMWVPGCILYVAASMGIIMEWYETDIPKDSQRRITNRLPESARESFGPTNHKNSIL